MFKFEKIRWLKKEHFSQWSIAIELNRINILIELSDDLCICGEIITSHHLENCNAFNEEVEMRTIDDLKHLLPTEQEYKERREQDFKSGNKEVIATGFNFDRSCATLLYAVDKDNLGMNYKGQWRRYSLIEPRNDIWESDNKPKLLHYLKPGHYDIFLCGAEYKCDRRHTIEKYKVNCQHCLNELYKLENQKIMNDKT